MKKNDLLLVYGTLMSGERMGLDSAAIGSGAQFVGNDRINGEIFNLGSYPGVKASATEAFNPDEPSVQGEVYRLRDDRTVTLLDSYEGYPYLYDRIQTTTESGRKVWVYTYNHEVSDAHRIASGAWRQRIQQQLVA